MIRSPVIRRYASRLLMTLLFSLGLTLPLMQAAGILFAWRTAVGVCAGLSALLSVSVIGKRARMIMPLVLLAGMAWYGLTGGADDVIEVARGIIWQASGSTAVLPLLADRAALVFAVVLTLLSSISAHRDAGGIPGFVLTLLVMSALWLFDCPQAIPLTAPAIGATLTQLGISRHERSGSIQVLPWMCLIALVVCLAVPSGGLTVTPLKELADELRERLVDTFFFTDSRSVFTLANEGWYPEGANQLGGPAQPYTHNVMAVNTSRRTYLRCVTKDTYTGRSWQTTLGTGRYLWIDPLQTTRRNSVFGADLPLAGTSPSARTVKVTMLLEGTSTLPMAQRMRSVSVPSDLVLYFSDAGEVFTTRNLAAGDTYTVTACTQTADDSGAELLAAACAGTNDPGYAQAVSAYTSLPGHLQSEVYNLARTACGSATTDFERASNIMHWLRTHCEYTLDADEVPSNVDFVTSFLLGNRRGYCTYYASAMTVMCRMVGIPARYVEGYLAQPQGGTAIVSGTDGHAWTEVYLNGCGWMVFDATPQGAPGSGAGEDADPQSGDDPQHTPTPTPEALSTPAPTDPPLPTDSPDEADTEPQEDPTDEPEDEEDPDDEEDTVDQTDEPEEDAGQAQSSFPWLLLLIIVLIAALAALIVWRLKATDPQFMASRAPDAAACYNVWRLTLMDILRVLKLPRAPDESPMAWLQRLHDECGLPGQVADAGPAEALAGYSTHAPDEASVTVMKRAVLALLPTLKPAQKLRLKLYRLFRR